MTMTFMEVQQYLAGTFQPAGITRAQLDEMFAIPFSWVKDAIDGAASTATLVTAIGRAPCALEVIDAYYTPDAALTAHDTNYATLNLLSGAGAAEAATVMGTILTKITGGTGDWVDNVPEVFTLTEANLLVAAGGVIAVSITKAGSGVAVPPGNLMVRCARRSF